MLFYHLKKLFLLSSRRKASALRPWCGGKFIIFIAFLSLAFPKISYSTEQENLTGKVVYKVIAGYTYLVGMEFLVDFDSNHVSGTYQSIVPVTTAGQPEDIEVNTNNYQITGGSFDPKTQTLYLKIQGTSKVDRKRSCYMDARETDKKIDEHSIIYTFETTIAASFTDDKRFIVTPELASGTSGFVTSSAPSPARQYAEGKWVTDCGTSYSSVGKRELFAVGNWEAVPKDKLKEYYSQDKNETLSK